MRLESVLRLLGQQSGGREGACAYFRCVQDQCKREGACLERLSEKTEVVINMRAEAFCVQGRLQSVENGNMTRDELKD